jgi:hypothetical protein
MRRLIKWIGGTAGGIAAYRFVRRQEASLHQAAPEVAVDEPDARADELRAKLAESRAAEAVTEEAEAVAAEEEPVPEPESPEEQSPEEQSPEDRRRRVHEEGRAALDEMHSE